MSEDKLIEAASEVKEEIKLGLLKKHITQVELSELINEGTVQINRAISGDMSPKSISIRKKIYKIID